MSSFLKSVHKVKAPSRWWRLVDRWLDGIEAGWGVPLLLAMFVIVWMMFATLAYWNVSLHPDVLEAWSVGRTLGWGNAKHPPLMGWMALGWSSVFPVTDWSMTLLALINATIGLWFVDLIARRFLKAEGRATVLLLAMLLPAYHFHAQRFNANAVLLAVWPMAIYFFLRSFEDKQSVGWAAAAGAASALAMLGKYYSVFLVASFVLAAAIHSERVKYFRSPAPWISALAGLVVLAPHLYWLITTDFLIFRYPTSKHVGLELTDVLGKSVRFVAGVAGWLVLPVFIWLAMLRGHLRDWFAGVRMSDGRLQLLTLIFIGTILLPIPIALTVRSSLPSIWALQGLFLVIVIVVCLSTVRPSRHETARLFNLVAALTVLIAVFAPLHAVYRNTHEFNERRNFYLPATQELMRQWRELSAQPLRRASGSEFLAFAIAFYSEDHPVFSRPVLPHGEYPLPPQRVLEGGWASLCFVDERVCTEWQTRVASYALNPVRFETDITTQLWGRKGVSRRVSGLMVPPANETLQPRSKPRLLHEDGIEEFGARRRP